MKMSVAIANPTHQNITDKTSIDMEELAKLDETLQMLAQVSLSLRTASNVTSRTATLRRKRSSRKVSFKEQERCCSPGYETLPRKITNHTTAPFSYTNGPVSFGNNSTGVQYATIIRAPRRNSVGKVTKLTRHRPHLKGKVNYDGDMKI